MIIMRKIVSILLAIGMMANLSCTALSESSNESNTLVVGYPIFTQSFSPFFMVSGYDADVVNIYTGTPLMVTDRLGSIVFNAVAGETIPYNGTDYTYYGIADLSVVYNDITDTTVYTASLRNDVYFSDGVALTADDLIFTYYVLLDPSYTGSNDLSSYNIVGLNAYQTQTPEDSLDYYYSLSQSIFSAGADHQWTAADAWTQEQQSDFWNELKTAWMSDIQLLVNYIANNFNTPEYSAYIGSTPQKISTSANLTIALGMTLWGFAYYNNGVLTAVNSNRTWNIADNEYPTIEDFYQEAVAKYSNNPDAYFSEEMEGIEETSTLASAQSAFAQKQAENNTDAITGVPNIAGIRKIDEYTVSITLNGYSASAAYQIFGITVAPMHYYGDTSMYDYAKNRFGFPFGDLSVIETKTSQPLGSGPYQYVKYENNTVYLEANPYYWKGEPKIKYIQLKETDANDVFYRALDVAEPSLNNDTITLLKEANNGALSGSRFFASVINWYGYGFIGITSSNVCVNDMPGSDASKNLRRALFTALALYRDSSIKDYYGEAATIINYPISSTSWAAPQQTDTDYSVAFSTDINNNDIYTATMTIKQKEDAVLAAIVGFLKAAGYTYNETKGKFTAAPQGALLEYEAIICGRDHPSFNILLGASNLLEKIGITLNINADCNFNDLLDIVNSSSAQLFCMAYTATIDPDRHMYNLFHSSNIRGAGGSDGNSYVIADSYLDQLLESARNNPDQAYRKSIYKTAMDIIMDWAVELPVYQRQEVTVFNAERVNVNTLPKDMTSHWSFALDIETLALK